MKSATLVSDRPQHFLLYEADWKQYVQLRRSLDERGQRAFITFDGHRIELMSPSMEHDRRAIYARLGVTEVWTYDAKQFQILSLHGKEYVTVPASIAFPMIRFVGVESLMQSAWTIDDFDWQSVLEDWVRKARAVDFC